MVSDQETGKDQPEEGRQAEVVLGEPGDASDKPEIESKPESGQSTEIISPQKQQASSTDSEKVRDAPSAEVGEEQSRLGSPTRSKEPETTPSWVLVLNDSNYSNYPYYMNTKGLPSQLDEPDEPYYVYDSTTAKYEPATRQPSSIAASKQTMGHVSEEIEEYTGYNPKIHGNYDPNASYNDYHKRKRDGEAAVEADKRPRTVEDQYTAMGAFNRFTGQFQTADQSAERYDDFHKSIRQMGAFFDVDAAANSHGGRSLKEERRNQKLSAKQLREMKEKQKQKKEEKKRRWLLS